MTPTVLWLVGEPGAGKTTLVRSILPAERRLIGPPKWTLATGFAAAGHYTGGTFDGADTVPYNGVSAALDYWQAMLRTTSLTIFDGDRFSNAPAVKFFREHTAPIHLRCAHLGGAVAAERRKERGGTQDATWVKGRITKARNFFESFPEAERLALDASLPTAVLAETLNAWLP